MTTTPQTNATLEQIAQVLRDGDDFVICGHVGPDGDCLGCQLTLHHALRALGKRSTCVLVRDEPISKSLQFMPGIREMVPAASYDGPCSVFVGVDVPSRERIGQDAVAILDRSDVSVTIDHHACDTTMCDYVYVDPAAAAASMLVWQVVKMLVPEPPLESAVCAYTGLITDTGGFRFQNTDPEAFCVASELIGRGVSPSYVAAEAFQNRTIASLRLESRAIERMQLLSGGQGVISWVLKADLEELGASKPDVEPLIDSLRALGGVRVACMLREQDGIVKGSLRSKDDTDVAALARELGGGGHKAAAGITLHMTMDEAVQLVSQRIREVLAAR